jgi:hypothetical protein
MPEGPEVDTDALHEAIHKEIHKEIELQEHKREDQEKRTGEGFLKRIAVTTALLAASAALASLQAGATVNRALVLKSEAVRSQGEASDLWAYYQAKSIKASILDNTRATWEAVGKPAPVVVEREMARYASEQRDLQARAEHMQHLANEQSEKADHLLHRHHGFANAVALFQVAIAIGALAALTRLRSLWYASGALGAVGWAFFVMRVLT